LLERSLLWIIGSRLFLLMTTVTLTSIAYFYMQDTFTLDRQDALNFTFIAGVLVIVFGAIATAPSGRLSTRYGRKRMIFLSAVIGFAGMVLVAIAGSPEMALPGVVPIGIAA